MGDTFDESCVCVYKVGGSLFDWPELFDRLTVLLEAEPGRPLLIAGGGAAADAVRTWDRVHMLGEAKAHRLAMASLRLGARFLVEGLHRAVLVAGRRDANAVWRTGRWPVLDADVFLEAEVAAGSAPLPASWDVTSDSVAAAIAAGWPADLVLLKSTSPALAREPFVDRHFPHLRPHVRSVEWCDLRTGQRGAL